ncbi:MAG: DUF3352 domain-containing protein [Blastocatellia bacterium]
MKFKSSIFVALCFALILPASVWPQSLNTRPRRAVPVAFEVRDIRATRATDSRAASPAKPATLESFVPREGLQFYFEIRNGGLAELARAGSAMTPVTKMLSAGPVKATTEDLTAFVISNLAALSNARLALAGYGTSGTAALIEAASPADAEQLRAGVSVLFTRNRAADLGIGLQGRMVVAGEKATVARILESNGTFAVVEDQGFMKARERFSADQFFAYAELGSQSLPSGFGTGNAAYDAGMLAGLGARPYAIAMGGSLQGDAMIVRALMLFSSKQSADSLFGMFGSLTSTGQTGQSVAATFAAPDADIFVGFMLDWDKLYDSIQSVLGMIATAQSNNNPQADKDLFAMAEASLGFSIKNDLIPTLGNEVAISLSGFDSVMRLVPQPGMRKVVAQKPTTPRFMLMVALKDPVRFEKLIARLVNPTGSQSPARVTYRNAAISYNKSFAYAITDKFFMIGGSVTDIRRALDAHALGTSLASTADYRAAVGPARQTMLQAYLSSNLSNKLYDSVLAEAAKSNAALKEFVSKPAQMRSAIGLAMLPDSDGLMMEMRVPTSLTFMALAYLATNKPAVNSPVSSEPSGLGIPNPTGPSTRTRTMDGRRVPTLTNEDLRDRRP